MANAQNILKDSDVSPFLFVVNPNSGTGKSSYVSKVLKGLNPSLAEVAESTSIEQSENIVKQALRENRRAIIAVGGDGTVHSIGKLLINTNTALGVIPVGSGNGIARHLGVSMNLKKAVQTVLSGHERTIDTFKVNGHTAIGFAGIGFDGKVAENFHNHHTRGFWSYVKLTLNTYRAYQSTDYSVDGKSCKQFALVVANISQYGNNAYINPLANDNDGKVELIFLKKPGVMDIPLAGYQLFNAQIHQSKLVEIQSKTQFSIDNKQEAAIHIDGEPVPMNRLIEIKVNPKSLTVICP
ncbi:MAG: YegS/Rv2252/BmrU family lipid kinase [Salibacteraceae bacterium]